MRQETRGQILIAGTALSLIALTLLPDLTRAIAKGQLTHCRSNLRQLTTALELYSADNRGSYPFHLSQLLARDPQGSPYLRQLPTCSSAGFLSYHYQVSTGPDFYTLRCGGNNHPCANPGCLLVGR